MKCDNQDRLLCIKAILFCVILIFWFSVIMLLIFVVEIVVGISAFTYRDRIQSIVSQRFLKVLHTYGQEPRLTNAIDSIQQEFQCCGAQNFTDWLNSTLNMPATSVPRSCCRRNQPMCGNNALDHMDNLFLEGCVVKMRNWISEHIQVIGAMGLGLGFSQIFGILLSWLLVNFLRESYAAV
ncbi:Novel Trtraspanin family [Pelobates cultripes]|uniref:Tetraspanin n=1 Tax=Pelobates cultripes TaxID=61616 RepID=A0AAD1SR19_PELCU|nr:Novel Trtraspanin family [Pelobates cultripes]